MAIKETKKPLTKKQKNYIYTGIFFAIVIMLFILNNINSGPDAGPYPPYYLDSQKSKLKLADYKGKVVVLNFYTTWSNDCKKSIPQFTELKNDYKKDSLEIIGINLDGITQNGITFSEVIPFIVSYKINYPVVIGTDKLLNAYGGISIIPTTFIIDKEGNIFSKHEGTQDFKKITIDIDKALEGELSKDKIKAFEFSLRQIN